MSRPPCCRRVTGKPVASAFQPIDPPSCQTTEDVILTLDEFEAIRLSDFEGLYQEQAAEKMNISRATYGRVLESAHRKLARMLVSGALLRIESGPVCVRGGLQQTCRFCSARLESAPHGPASCVSCRSNGFEGNGCSKNLPCPGRRCQPEPRVKKDEK